MQYPRYGFQARVHGLATIQNSLVQVFHSSGVVAASTTVALRVYTVLSAILAILTTILLSVSAWYRYIVIMYIVIVPMGGMLIFGMLSYTFGHVRTCACGDIVSDFFDFSETEPTTCPICDDNFNAFKVFYDDGCVGIVCANCATHTVVESEYEESGTTWEIPVIE